MGLRSQLFQRLLRVLHGITLGTECRIPQTWATVFAFWAVAKTTTPIVAITKAPICARAATAIPITWATISAISGTSTTPRHCRGILLHARPVVTTHRNHRARSRLGSCGRWGRGLARDIRQLLGCYIFCSLLR